jgi:Protein of unknown function (DUF4058)
MPSPFPGMNPYFEQEAFWPDFHQAFCSHLREVLVPQVRPEFFVRLEEHLYIHELTVNERRLVGRNIDEERSSFLEVRDSKDRSLVAVIELLSPSNKKPGPDREAFLAKRRQLLASSVHYVEIDLLRGGPRMPIDGLPDCDYCVLVSRYEERPEVGTWAIRLREPLPVVHVPLRAPRAHAQIDLQAALHHLYDAAGYQDFIYSGRPSPRLHPQDDAWATQTLKEAGLMPQPS